MTRDVVKAYLSQIGTPGGKSTFKKHGKKKLTAWGKLGGKQGGTGKKKRRKR
jgi:hypothetical protein